MTTTNTPRNPPLGFPERPERKQPNTGDTAIGVGLIALLAFVIAACDPTTTEAPPVTQPSAEAPALPPRDVADAVRKMVTVPGGYGPGVVRSADVSADGVLTIRTTWEAGTDHLLGMCTLAVGEFADPYVEVESADGVVRTSSRLGKSLDADDRPDTCRSVSG